MKAKLPTRPLAGFFFGFMSFFLGNWLAGYWNRHNVFGIRVFFDDLAIGIAAGLLVGWFEFRREETLKRKFQTIRLMNHHVRNALQVISLASTEINEKEKQISLITESVNRIDWALREVLPGESPLTYDDGPPKPKSEEQDRNTG